MGLLSFLKMNKEKRGYQIQKIQSLNQWASAEIWKDSLLPFLYGKYEQDISDDFDQPSLMVYKPFIVCMTQFQMEDVIMSLHDGYSREFEAMVYERSIQGFAKAKIKGEIDPSLIQFIKNYETLSNTNPIEYKGAKEGAVYKGKWHFAGRTYDGGGFLLSKEKSILSDFLDK
jgi:hypothetical protein